MVFRIFLDKFRICDSGNFFKLCVFFYDFCWILIWICVEFWNFFKINLLLISHKPKPKNKGELENKSKDVIKIVSTQ